MSESKKDGVLASVAKMFRPDPSQPAAEPPRCCGECGGEKKKQETSEAGENRK